MKLITNNWSLKLMALAVAVVLWSHVRGEVNPWEEATFRIPVGIHPPAGMVVVNAAQLPRTVKVAVRAPRLTLRQLKGVAPANPFATTEEAPLLNDGKIRAEVEFAVATAGRQKAPIQATAQLDDVQIMGVNPDNVAVVLDQAASVEFAVQPRLSGANGDDYELKGFQAEPAHAQVLGLSAEVARVAAVQARVAPAELTVNVPAQARVALTPVDASGAALPFLRVQPPFAVVKATLREKQRTRRVPVVAHPAGTPAAGWRLASLQITPDTLLVRGPRSTRGKLEELPAPVDVSGLSGSARRHVAVTLPAGVRAVGASRVRADLLFVRAITPTPAATRKSATPHLQAPTPTGVPTATTSNTVAP
jgi:YbbR domain-containing protein